MRFVAVLAVMLGASGAAHAQGHDHGHHAAPAAAVAQAEGVVKSIDTQAGAVTIAHGPIKALNWGAMTMAFKADPATLKGLAVGDRVSFTLKGQQITEIRKR